MFLQKEDDTIKSWAILIQRACDIESVSYDISSKGVQYFKVSYDISQMGVQHYIVSHHVDTWSPKEKARKL